MLPHSLVASSSSSSSSSSSPSPSSGVNSSLAQCARLHRGLRGRALRLAERHRVLLVWALLTVLAGCAGYVIFVRRNYVSVDEIASLRDALARSRLAGQARERWYEGQLQEVAAELAAAAGAPQPGPPAGCSSGSIVGADSAAVQFELQHVVAKVNRHLFPEASAGDAGRGGRWRRAAGELDRLQWFGAAAAGVGNITPGTTAAATAAAVDHNNASAVAAAVSATTTRVCDAVTRELGWRLHSSDAAQRRRLWLAGPTLELYLEDTVLLAEWRLLHGSSPTAVTVAAPVSPSCDLYVGTWHHGAAEIGQQVAALLPGLAAQVVELGSGNRVFAGLYNAPTPPTTVATAAKPVPYRVFLLNFRTAVNYAWHFTMERRTLHAVAQEARDLHPESPPQHWRGSALECVFALAAAGAPRARVGYSSFTVQPRWWTEGATGTATSGGGSGSSGNTRLRPAVNVPGQPWVHLANLGGISGDFARARYFAQSLRSSSVRGALRTCAVAVTPLTGGNIGHAGGSAGPDANAAAEAGVTMAASWTGAVLLDCAPRDQDSSDGVSGGSSSRRSAVQVMPWQRPGFFTALYNSSLAQLQALNGNGAHARGPATPWTLPEWLVVPDHRRRSGRRQPVATAGDSASGGGNGGDDRGSSRSSHQGGGRLLLGTVEADDTGGAGSQERPRSQTGRDIVNWLREATNKRKELMPKTRADRADALTEGGGKGFDTGTAPDEEGAVAYAWAMANLDARDGYDGREAHDSSGASNYYHRSNSRSHDYEYASANWNLGGAMRQPESCSDSCGAAFTHNGRCEDGSDAAPGSNDAVVPCDVGTDCSDCASRRRGAAATAFVDVVLDEDSTVADVARRHGVSCAAVCTLNGLPCRAHGGASPGGDNDGGDGGGGSTWLLPQGSELLLTADVAEEATTRISSWWAFRDAGVGAAVLVDWTGDGRNVLAGTVVAVAPRRGIARVVPQNDARRFTHGAGRWFRPEDVYYNAQPLPGRSDRNGAGRAGPADAGGSSEPHDARAGGEVLAASLRFVGGLRDVAAEAAARRRQGAAVTAVAAARSAFRAPASSASPSAQDVPVYFDLPVLLPRHVAAAGEAAAAAATAPATAAAAGARVGGAAPPPLPWTSWVAATAWYPDNDPLAAEGAWVVCNLGAAVAVAATARAASSTGDTPRPITVRVADLARLVPLWQDAGGLAALRHLEAAAQVRAAVAIFERATRAGPSCIVPAAATAADVDANTGAPPQTPPELRRTAAAQGRAFFLLHDSVQVWQRACSVPMRWSGAAAGFPAGGPGGAHGGSSDDDEEDDDEPGVVHFGVFLDDAEDVDGPDGIEAALVGAGFELLSSRSGDAAHPWQVDFRVRSACVPLSSPFVAAAAGGERGKDEGNESASRSEEEQDDDSAQRLGVLYPHVPSAGPGGARRCLRPGNDGGGDGGGGGEQQVLFFREDRQVVVTVRLNFLRSRCSAGLAEPGSGASGGGGGGDASRAVCSDRWGTASQHAEAVQLRRSWVVPRARQARASAWGSDGWGMPSPAADEWESAVEHQPAAPLCWVHLLGARVPAQCI